MTAKVKTMRDCIRILVITCLLTCALAGCTNMAKLEKLCELVETGQNDRAKELAVQIGNLNQETAPNGLLLLTQGEAENSTPLYSACRSGNAEMVSFLLERGADPNYTGSALATPLEAYCAQNISGDMAVLQALVKSGADVNAFTYEPPVFRIAEKLQYLDQERAADAAKMITFLLDNGAGLTSKERTSTLLHYAVQAPDTTLLTSLLERYGGMAYIDGEDHEGDTALDIAEALGNEEAVLLLRKYGAD